MKRSALLLMIGALLLATPARADFFKDLGEALGQLGNAIEGTAKDIGPAIAPKPAAPIPAPTPVGEIIWNSPPPTTAFSGATVYTPPTSVRPPALPERRRNTYNATVSRQAAPESVATTPAGYSISRDGLRDDAPPPRRAPRRNPVEASFIAPLPGFTQAPPRAPATYSPVLAAASLADSQVAQVQASRDLPARIPVAKPAVVQSRDFVVTYSGFKARISDTLVGSTSAAPGGDSKLLVEALTASLRRDPGQRVRLRSEAIAVDDRLSEARKRSFDRALLVKNWLEAAGARPTQIDLEVAGAGNADQVALNVYKP